MGDIELSLDDIIKKKSIKTGINRGRNNLNVKKPIGVAKRLSDQNRNAKTQALNTNNKTFLKSRPGVLKSIRNATSPPAKVGDARLKIIQKQRQKITDARDKLGQIAKQTDARLRLLKLRERQRIVTPGRIQDARALIPEEHLLQRTIRGNLTTPAYDDTFIARSFAERAVIDPEAYLYRRQEAPLIYRTIENDLPHRLAAPEQNIYRWNRPGSTSPVLDDLSDIPMVKLGLRTPQMLSINNKRSNNWESEDPPIVITKKLKPETVGILKRTQPTTIVHGREAVRIIKESPPPGLKPKGPVKTLSERFCQDGNPSAQKISQLKARLEASQLSNKNSKPAVGHRIIVSNLVPSVTHEDVKELFEDIGELLSSKVIRPGTAEVVYKLHKDAVKAVDVYHNRQLDGQPMKCLLVNSKPVTPLNPKTGKNIDKKTGKPVIELDMTAFRKALHRKSTS